MSGIPPPPIIPHPILISVVSEEIIHEEKSDVPHHFPSITENASTETITSVPCETPLPNDFDEKYEAIIESPVKNIEPSEFEEGIGVSDIEIVSNISCCLSFLLHEDSPLWDSDNEDEDVVTPKIPSPTTMMHGHSQSTNVHLSVLKQIKQGKGFQKRCAKWQSDHNITLTNLPNAEKAEHALASLSWNDHREERWPKLMLFWNSWSKYKRIHPDDIQVEALEWTTEDINAIDSTLDLLLGKSELVHIADDTRRPSNPLNDGRRISRWKSMENPLNLLIANGSPTPNVIGSESPAGSPITQYSAMERTSILCKDDRLCELSDIDNKSALRNWLKRYKVKAMLRQAVIEDQRKFSNIGAYFRSFGDGIRSCFDGVTREIRSFLGEIGEEIRRSIVGDTLFEDDEGQLGIDITQLPLRHWTWRHVVYYVERIDHLKQFAGIFHEWRIDGDELLVMTAKHIHLLVECCKGYPGHHDIVKLLDEEDIEQLIMQIKKCFIVSTITFEYDLYWRVLNNIKDNEHHPLCSTVLNIIDIIHFLRPEYCQGPKAIWKLQDALYFSKIDNMLCILVIGGRFKKLFQDCYPRFIFDDKLQHSYLETRFDLARLRTARAPSSILLKQEQTFNTLVLDVYDVLEDNMREKQCWNKIVDKCRSSSIGDKCRPCFEYVQEFDRVYYNVIVMLCVCLTVCCLITWVWMSYKAKKEISTALSWASQSIAERAIQEMEYEFFIPQMILHLAVSGLYTGDIPINASEYTDGRYDRYFTQFKQYTASKSIVYSLFMYETVSGTMIGSYMNNFTNVGTTEPIMFVYHEDTGCATYYLYNEQIGRRNSTLNIECDAYDPLSRPWYTLAAQNNDGYVGWTAPYKFYAGNTYGITLIYKIIYNDIEVIFLCEFTVNSIKSIISTIGGVEGSILYIMTNDGSVIGSDIGEFDIDIDCDSDCYTRNPLIIDSADRIRDSGYLKLNITGDYSEEEMDDLKGFSDDYSLTLFFFKTVHALHAHHYTDQYGMIVLLYDNTHFNEIKIVRLLAILLYLGSMLTAILVICLMGNRLQKIEKQIKSRKSLRPSYGLNMTGIHHSVPSDSVYLDDIESHLDEAQNEYNKKRIFKVSNSCICEHKTLLLCSFWYSMLVFVATYFLWIMLMANSLNGIIDVFLEQEYLIVHDKVTSVLSIAESIADIVEERFSRPQISQALREDTFSAETDIFFAHLMRSIKYANGDYYAYSVSVGTPDGKFIGTVQNDDSETVYLAVRDMSTNWITNQYILDEMTYQRTNNISNSIKNYDPRCELWYNQTLEFMFDGNIEDAFGGIDNFDDFFFPTEKEKISAELMQKCIDVKAHYERIWNAYIEVENATDYGIKSQDINDVYLTNVRRGRSHTCTDEGLDVPLTKYDIIWNKDALSSTDSTTLIASKPIIDTETGQVLGILSIDLSLQKLSDALNKTNNYNIGENDWISWIFDGSGDYKMIASSDGQVMDMDSDTEFAPYDATSHPNKTIRVFSKQILELYPDRCGSNALPVSSYQQYITHSEGVPLPIDTPELKAGRVLSHPFGDNGVEINWIIAKSIDIDKFQTEDGHDKEIIGFVIICTLLAIWYVQSSIQVGHVQNTQATDHDIFGNTSKRDIALDDDVDAMTKKLKDLRFELENIIEGAASEIWGLFLQQYFSGDSGSKNGVLTATVAKEFMAKESNKHIASENEDHITVLLYALQLQRQWAAFRMFSFIHSSRYNIFITICIMIHCLASINLPETPTVLKHTPIDWLTLTVIYIIIVIEVSDTILMAIARYIEFGIINRNILGKLTKLKYGFKHKYVKKVAIKPLLWLIFQGPNHSKIFLTQIVLVSLIIFNILTMTTHKIGIFEYYIPIVPVLFAVRSREIRRFSYQFFYAVYLAKDVLVSYGFLITIVAIFGQAIFKEILNVDSSTDTFTSTTRAWITSFVFVSTGENYNDVVYNALGAGIDSSDSPNLQSVSQGQMASGNLMFFVIISVIGLYFFIPIIIRKFELAFDHSRHSRRDKNVKAKINALIAAFIMLDMNDDGSIDVNEFQYLVHSSIVSREAFVAEDEDLRDEISLYEFVTTLVTINKSLDSAITGEDCNNTQYQSYLECNWFRTRNNRLYTLVFILIPSVAISLLRGLSGVSDFVTSFMIATFFIYNFMDINLRCYAFGRKRCSSLNRYKTPPFVEEAILNWKISRGMNDNDESTKLVKLTHIEKRWVAKELEPTRPMTKWQKRTTSLVHRFELYIIWFGFIGFILSLCLPYYLAGYRFLFLQIYLLRVFTLIQSNQNLVVLIFTIVPRFLNLLAFVMIFIFIWARIGCTIFAKKTDIVPEEIYSTGANASFDTLGTSILTLLQLMVGEGWHEIMYKHMLATSVKYSAYFIFYIIFVTLIISNIFIGLFLSEMDELDNEQSDDQLLSDYQSDHYNFNFIATKRKKILNNKLNNLKNSVSQTEKQIDRINELLQKNREKKLRKNRPGTIDVYQ